LPQYQRVCSNNRQEGSVAAQQRYQIIVVSLARTHEAMKGQREIYCIARGEINFAAYRGRQF